MASRINFYVKVSLPKIRAKYDAFKSWAARESKKTENLFNSSEEQWQWISDSPIQQIENATKTRKTAVN